MHGLLVSTGTYMDWPKTTELESSPYLYSHAHFFITRARGRIIAHARLTLKPASYTAYSIRVRFDRLSGVHLSSLRAAIEPIWLPRLQLKVK